MRNILLAAALVTLSLKLTAWSAPTPPPPAPAPATQPAIGLIVQDAELQKGHPLRLEEAHMSVTLEAPLAQTTVTMRLRNALQREIEADLEFPLPEGASVSGYGLDVPAGSGELVEGVIVPKERARQIFSTEVNRRIDPGLVEQLRGNNYRIRVYPIPPGGTRSVQITFISNMTVTDQEAVYALPLLFPEPLAKAGLRIEVACDPASVKVEGLPGLVFRPAGGHAVAEEAFEKVALSGTLRITQMLPNDIPIVRVEPRVSPSLPAALGRLPDDKAPDRYFLFWARVPADLERPQATPSQVGIIWDTSLSRARDDRRSELQAVRALFAALPEATIHVYNTDGDRLRSFSSGQVQPCVEFIASLPCDGALRLDQFFPQTNSYPERPELYFLFSDGLVSLGRSSLASPVPVHAFSCDPGADHAMLISLASQTGGTYQNLQRITPARAIRAALSRPIVATLSAPGIAEVYPKTVPATPGSRILFAGKAAGPLTEARLTFSYAGESAAPLSEQQIQLPPVDEGSRLVAHFWAGQKAADLALDRATNADALLALAREFNLVTPDTSLLVLETLDQYLRYRVLPPKTRPEIYRSYMERIEAESSLVRDDGAKIPYIIARWRERVAWWNQEFAVTREQLAGRARPVPQGSDTASQGLFGDSSSLPPASASSPTVAVQPKGGMQMRSSVPGRALRSGGAEENQVGVSIRPWSPNPPYLQMLAAAPADRRYAIYLAQRDDYWTSPSYYFECANFFLEQGDRPTGIRILTNIAQLRLGDARLMRLAGQRLLQIGAYDLAIEFLELAVTDLQGWRDLALALAARGEHLLLSPQTQRDAYHDFRRALALYDRIAKDPQAEANPGLSMIALTEANALWARIERLQAARPGLPKPANALDPRLVKNLDCDLRILLECEEPSTIVYLEVREPTGEKARNADLTFIGGRATYANVQEYAIHRAYPGRYQIYAQCYQEEQQAIVGSISVQVTVFTHFGRPDERRETRRMRLGDSSEMFIGEVTIAPPKER